MSLSPDEQENIVWAPEKSEKPWAWKKCYEMGDRSYHWALISPSQRDCGVGDGRTRVIGLVLLDCWSEHPDDVMTHVIDCVNVVPELVKELKNLAMYLKMTQLVMTDSKDRALTREILEYSQVIIEKGARLCPKEKSNVPTQSKS